VPLITPIAWTDSRLVDFAPYVPAIDDDGSIAFQATRADGSHAILVHRAGRLETVASTGTRFSRFISHPALDEAGAVCWFAEDQGHKTALLCSSDGAVASVQSEGEILGAIGPLGPTASEGRIAFRADRADGRAAVFLQDRGSLIEIAAAEGEVAGFQGLPVVSAGDVLFRVDLVNGGSAIDLWHQGKIERVAVTGPRWVDLGRFPIMTPGGSVAFVATCRDGSMGMFSGKPGAIEALPLEASKFESLRGGLITDGSHICVYATPPGGSLGIYFGDTDRPVLEIGRPLEGSVVAEFALNPVSINRRGQVAVRVSLDDGRQTIVRIDPDPGV